MLESEKTTYKPSSLAWIFCVVCAVGILGGWSVGRLHRGHRQSQLSKPTLSQGSETNSIPTPRGPSRAEQAAAEMRAAQQRAEAARPFILEASKLESERLQSLMTAYLAALKSVRQPPLLELTSVTEVKQLQEKKQIVRGFMTSNETLRAFLEHREQNYRDTVGGLGLPVELMDYVMEVYGKTATQPTAIALRMRDDDSRMGTALLGMIEILETNCGKWTYNPTKGRVEFVERAVQEQFLDLKESLDQASLDQMAAQVKLAAIETPQQ